MCQFEDRCEPIKCIHHKHIAYDVYSTKTNKGSTGRNLAQDLPNSFMSQQYVQARIQDTVQDTMLY